VNNKGYLSASWIYSHAIEAPAEGGTGSTAVLVGDTGYSSSQADRIVFVTSGNMNTYVDSSGVYRSSDIRIKTNIEPFPKNLSASEILSDIDIFSYNHLLKHKNGTVFPGKQRIWGFSAQNLASKVDNIVIEGGEDQFESPWTYSGKSLEGFFVQAIKELKLENNQLKAEVKDLKENHRRLAEDSGSSKMVETLMRQNEELYRRIESLENRAARDGW